MKPKILKKWDIILIFAAVMIIAVSFALRFFLKKDGKKITVKQDDVTVYSGNLDTDKKIVLKHNTLVVKDGRVYMECADCKNQICVLTGKISDSGESIVCLPNKVVAEIE